MIRRAQPPIRPPLQTVPNINHNLVPVLGLHGNKPSILSLILYLQPADAILE
jgi:hypothetical protein